MKYLPNKTMASQAGVTLVELVAGLAIASLIALPLAGIINQFIFLPGQWSASISVMNNSRAAVRAVAEDARQASGFSPGTEPDYGTFSWTDRAGYPTSTFAVRYFHSAEDASLMREETVSGLFQTNLVAEGVQGYSDVSIQETGGLVTASVTSTRESIKDVIARNASITVQMRPALTTAQPSPPSMRLAWDDFESGGFAGGSHWLDGWQPQGSVAIESAGVPFEGSYHLQLAGSNDYVERMLDLSGQQNVRLQLWAKASGFDATDTVALKVSPNGVDFTTVRTWTNADPDDVYQAVDVDLSSFAATSEFFVAFDGSMPGGGDSFYVDDVKVVRTLEP